MLEPFTKIDTEVREKLLDVMSFAIGHQIDGLRPEHIEVQMNELPNRMAVQFVARFRMAGEVVQDRKLLALYPKRGIINAIRFELSELAVRYPRALGWLRKAKPVMIEHRVYQAMVYPDIPFLKNDEKVRIFFQHSYREVGHDS